jgi:hypothetical protein
VGSRCEQHGQRWRLTRELVVRVRCSLHRGLLCVGRGGNPDSDPHSSIMRHQGATGPLWLRRGVQLLQLRIDLYKLEL